MYLYFYFISDEKRQINYKGFEYNIKAIEATVIKNCANKIQVVKAKILW